MAFVFTVETGTGTVSAANSYVSVADADDILATNIHVTTAWTALTDSNKEKLLASATAYLDTRTKWKGTKTVSTSPLRWPRTGVCDRDEISIDKNTIPHQLKVATAEMARYMMVEDRTIEGESDGIERIRADVVEIEFTPGYRLPQTPSALQYLVHGLGAVSGGGGTKFVPISR